MGEFTDIQLTNGSDYYGFYIELKNYTMKNPVIINRNAVIELHIIERFDYLAGPTEGYLTVFSGNEALENDDMDTNNPDAGDDFDYLDSAIFPTYLLRNDGRDTLKIKIAPVDEHGNKILPDDVWLMDYDFVVRDIEDLKSTNNMSKVKRIYFWDATYQRLRENNSMFSTSNPIVYNPTSPRKVPAPPIISISGPRPKPLNINPAQTSDDVRKMYTGDAIQQCLRDNGFEYYMNLGFWERGETRIFYTSPLKSSVYDDLKYLMSYHLSEYSAEANWRDSSMLFYDRYIKKLNLLPMKWHYDYAGKGQPKFNQLEHLFLQKTGDDTDPLKLYIAPIGIDTNPARKFELNMLDNSKIITYQFVDMSGFDSSQLIVSHPTYTYDSRSKRFMIYTANANNILNLKPMLKKKYTDVLHGSGPSPLITLNETKKSNMSINPEWTPQYDCIYPMYKGLKKLTHSSVFLNECINFWIVGATCRKPGRFYAIDKSRGATGKLAYKLYGQWLGVEIKHVFARNNVYTNNITAVKVQSYEDLGLNEGIS